MKVTQVGRPIVAADQYVRLSVDVLAQQPERAAVDRRFAAEHRANRFAHSPQAPSRSHLMSIREVLGHVPVFPEISELHSVLVKWRGFVDALVLWRVVLTPDPERVLDHRVEPRRPEDARFVERPPRGRPLQNRFEIGHHGRLPTVDHSGIHSRRHYRLDWSRQRPALG
jgi:hypothetical protein